MPKHPYTRNIAPTTESAAPSKAMLTLLIGTHTEWEHLEVDLTRDRARSGHLH